MTKLTIQHEVSDQDLIHLVTMFFDGATGSELLKIHPSDWPTFNKVEVLGMAREVLRVHGSSCLQWNISDKCMNRRQEIISAIRGVIKFDDAAARYKPLPVENSGRGYYTR